MRSTRLVPMILLGAVLAGRAMAAPVKTDAEKAAEKAFGRAVTAYRGEYHKIKTGAQSACQKALHEAQKELAQAGKISVDDLRALKMSEARAKVARNEARMTRLKNGQLPLELAFASEKGDLASFDGGEVRSVTAYFSPTYHNVFFIRGEKNVTIDRVVRQVVDNHGTQIVLAPKVVGQTTESKPFECWVIVAGQEQPICKKPGHHSSSRSSSKYGGDAGAADGPVSDKAEFIGTIRAKMLPNSAVTGKVLYFTGDLVRQVPIKNGRRDAKVAYCFDAQAVHDAAFPERAVKKKAGP